MCHEGRAKAGAESSLRLGQSDLGAGQTCGKALHKVIHHIAPFENGDGGQDAEGIGRQQHDSLWMITSGSLCNVGITRKRIGESCVLRDRAISQVQILRVGLL